ncbi:hypothetical protein RN001_001239 [Aquatica leii]|uniref:THAP-type domain-containing protein n=1 Tax=Aquatica leii TaxID=1421715 RepID=A0AAN7SQU4_9COLE|nr:hypothetical protein RN001_001239 [Aquatica leii]
MPRKCCVPGCKSNYDSTSRENLQCVTTFSFPKNEEIRSKWLRAIPRKDWIPTPSSVVCCKHFNDMDIIRFHKFLQPDGSCTQVALRYPKLKDVAVPCIFPNLPAYLSPPAKSTRVDPETRRHNILKVHSERVSKFLKADDISDFNDLITNYSKQVNVFNWEVKVTATHIHFFIIKFEQPLAIERSISIDKELCIKIYLGKNELLYNDLKWILSSDLRLRKWSQMANVLSRYKFHPESSIKPSVTNLVEKCLQYIEKAYEIYEEEDDFAYRKQLTIIRDQLKIIVSKTQVFHCYYHNGLYVILPVGKLL